MRTILIVLVAIAILALIGFVAIPGLWSHSKQWRKDIAMKVDEASSDEHIKGIYEEALSEAGEDLRNHYCNVYQVKEEIAKVETVQETLQKELTKEEQVLQRAQELLEKNQPSTTIVIGGTNYTWEQLNNDASRRVSTCKVLRRNVLDNEQSLSKLQKAYNDGIERIREAKNELGNKKLEFEAEKAELAALRAQEQVNKIIGKIYETGNIKIDLGRARKIFEDRLNNLRAKAEYDQEIGLKADVINTWDTELGIPKEEAVESIKAYFQEKESKPAETEPNKG